MIPTKPRAWLIALLAAIGSASALAVHVPSQDHHSRQHQDLANQHAKQNLESRTSTHVHDLFLGTCRALCSKVFEEGTWEYDHCAGGCYHDHPNGDYSSDESREEYEGSPEKGIENEASLVE